MTPPEVQDLLRFCSTVDPWLKATSPEEGAVMVAGWAMMLEALPADVAMRAARAHYSHGGERTITPGDLLDAWADHRRREAPPQSLPQPELAGDLDPEAVFGSASQYLTDMMAAVARGQDPASVPRPAGVRVLTLSPEQEAKMRACAFPTICVCTHLECWGGWLDEETTRRSVLGQDCAQVKRCPQCDDGLQMAQEKGVARKPRRTPAGR